MSMDHIDEVKRDVLRILEEEGPMPCNRLLRRLIAAGLTPAWHAPSLYYGGEEINAAFYELAVEQGAIERFEDDCNVYYMLKGPGQPITLIHQKSRNKTNPTNCLGGRPPGDEPGSARK